MKKSKLILCILFCVLTACDLFGWDSSGGVTDPTNGVIDGVEFLVSIPSSYPYVGKGEILSSPDGPLIIVGDIDLKSDVAIDDLSDEDAFKIVEGICDQDVDSLSLIDFQINEVIISWVNSNSLTGSLSLSNETVGSTAKRQVECL